MYNTFNKKYGYLLDNINGYPLDKQQRKAVFCNKQNTMVIAGAGSGKTTTIIGKIKYLIEGEKIKPQDILCISFTNESVNDLKDALLKNNINEVPVLTFHKLALNILNHSFNIVSSDYLEFIINEILYDYDSKTKKTLFTIINLIKSQNLATNVFYKIPKKYSKLIILIIQIMITYAKEKLATNSIDLDDVIIIASKCTNELNYKYIIIDEYQDSSLIRVKLIQNIIKWCHAKVLVVGDDWQSIYRFSGCDINVFLNFKHYFHYSKTIKLKNTYRNSRQLIKVASDFIMKNPYQIKKNLISNKDNIKPFKIIYYKNKSQILSKVLKLIPVDQNVLILGRNNFDIKEYLNDEMILDNNCIKFKNNLIQDIKYLTIHKSKGLESDNVIIINLENSRYGIPSQVDNHPLINYFYINKIKDDDEERRLFYVAITRTKNNVYLLVNKKNPSIYIKELLKNQSKYIEIIF